MEDISEEKNVEINQGRWTREEHDMFLQGLKEHGKEWKKIADMIRSRTVVQIRTHAQKYFQKVAKNTGQPVMSTSKKGDVIRPPNRKARKTGDSPDDSSGEEDGSDTHVSSPMGMSVNVESKPQPLMLQQTEQQQQQISKPQAAPHPTPMARKPESIRVPSTFNKPSSGKNNLGPLSIDSKRTEEGGATPRTFAAATILLRPRIQHRIQSGNDTPKTREQASWLESHQERAAQVLGKRNRSTPTGSSVSGNGNAKQFSDPVQLSWEAAVTNRSSQTGSSGSSNVNPKPFSEPVPLSWETAATNR